MGYTKKDLEAAYNAGANKATWTQVKLTGVVSGNPYTLEPVFENWFTSQDELIGWIDVAERLPVAPPDVWSKEFSVKTNFNNIYKISIYIPP